MAERIKILVRPSGAHSDILTIEDAMRQVLDLFDTIEPAPGVEWRLAVATTNSPFYVEGEAISLTASVDVTVIARAQKQNLAKGLREIVSGAVPSDPDFRIAPARRLFARNLNGIGTTEVDLEIGEPIRITPDVAQKAIEGLEGRPATIFDMPRGREEVGSVEGTLQDIGTHYHHPAARIIERRTKDALWCRLTPELQKSFQDKATYADVWQHRAVVVRGRIRYGKDGGIEYVFAHDIQRLNFPTVSLEAIRDPGFTSGLSVAEYLDKFRDGALG